MRRLAIALSLMVLAVTVGCEEPSTPRRAVAGASPQPTPNPGLAGGIVVTSPSPAPEQLADPTPGPTPTGSGLHATALYVQPEAPVLFLPPGAGTDPVLGQPTSLRLTALVTKSNGETDSDVTWVSLAPGVASVDAAGLVAALAPGSGPGPWVVGIRATSRDGQASLTRLVTIRDEGGVTAVIE